MRIPKTVDALVKKYEGKYIITALPNGKFGVMQKSRSDTSWLMDKTDPASLFYQMEFSRVLRDVMYDKAVFDELMKLSDPNFNMTREEIQAKLDALRQFTISLQ
jgi:hypothetical protein